MPAIIKEKVIWTLCPQGVTSAGTLRLSVYVSPRLTTPAPDARLIDAINWKQWPKVVEGCTFQVMATPTGPGPAVAVGATKLLSAPRADIYAALFDPDKTPVESYTFTDLKGMTFVSYPVAQMTGVIEGLYAKLGLTATSDMPTSKDLIGAQWPGSRGNDVAAAAPTGQALLPSIKSLGVDGMAQTQDGLFDLFSFYHTPLLTPETMGYTRTGPADKRQSVHYPGYKKPPVPTAAALTQQTDFHRIAAGLGNFAELARYCGLILDFEVTPSHLPPGPCRLSLSVIRPGRTAPDPIDSFPITDCHFEAQDFVSVAADPATFAGRFLSMDTQGLDLIQMDVDGAAHKAMALGTSLPRMQATAINDDSFDAPAAPDAAAPSLRSAGLMLAQAGRHTAVDKKVSRSSDLNTALASGTTELKTEDLIRGYRIDILDLNSAQPQWRSLCRRLIHYDFLKPAPLLAQTLIDLKLATQADGTVAGLSLAEEEGAISLALGSSPDGSVPGVYTLHEGLFVWRGWSLCAPEPFNALRANPLPTAPGATQAEQDQAMVGDTTAEVPPGLPLKPDFIAAKGSLPALRFGHAYQVRVRCIDLCGGSASFTDAGSGAVASPKVAYQRYEPLESPVITLVGTVVTGQDTTANPAHVETPLQGESMGRLAVRTYNDVPADNTVVNTAQVRRNVAPGRVTQRFAETHGVLDDASTGRLNPNVYNMLVKLDNGFANADVPPVEDPAGKTSRYSVTEKGFHLPYLPDPYALGIGVRLKGLGDATWYNLMVPLYGDGYDPTQMPPDWPKSQAVMIAGSETYKKLNFDSASRTIQVPMPKGCRQRLRLSSLLPNPAIDNMALWALIQKSATSEQQKATLPQLLDLIRRGEHWMFTPWREIELVHATQRPLVRPAFVDFAQTRAVGALDTFISCGTPVSGPSTVRLDLDAAWDDPEDNPVDVAAKSAPLDRVNAAHVSQIPIARLDGLTGDYPLKDVVHHFPDTRYRRVRYTLTAVTRFKEFFEKTIRDDETKQIMPSAPYTAWVKSSAPPPAPGVVYVIPTFGWFRSQSGFPASKRSGGVRVYLDRPWMVSGYNEMLAVILPNPGDPDATGDGAGNQPFVTQWGRDPVTISAGVTSNSPKPSAFALAKWQGPLTYPGTSLPAVEGSDLPAGNFVVTGLHVPGQDPAKTFAIAPHQAGFDPDRQLWYVDITVDIPRGSYFPFLRLAVARYQPFSVDDVHLSSAVTCDFMQLSPDRIAVVVPMDVVGTTYNVFVYGDLPRDQSNHALARLGTVTAQCQVLDAGADPTLGWRDQNGVMPQGPHIDYTPQGLAQQQKVEDQLQTDAFNRAALTAAQLSQTPVGTAPAKPAGNVAKPQLQGYDMSKITAQQANSTSLSVAGAPTLIWQGSVNMPAAPAGGGRRLLICETETYSNGAKDIDRVIYAEALVF